MSCGAAMDVGGCSKMPAHRSAGPGRGQMTRLAATIVGVLLLVAPLMWLSSLIPVPEYRTGTFEDLQFPVTAGVTLYGGVLAGASILWRLKAGRGASMNGQAVLFAGWIGALTAIGVALAIWALHEWLSTGRVLQRGQSAALLPIFPIIGGVLSLFIAGGAALVFSGLRRP